VLRLPTVRPLVERLPRQVHLDCPACRTEPIEALDSTPLICTLGGVASGDHERGETAQASAQASARARARRCGRAHDDGRSGRGRAHRPWHRHDLRAAGRAQRLAVRRAIQGRRPHPHHSHAARTGCGLSRPRRGAGDRQPAGLFGGAWTRLAQLRGRAAHRLRHERTGAGAGRANPAIRDRPRTWAPARDSRSGGDHRPSGRFFRAHSRAGAGGRARRASATRDANRPARSGRAGMRHRCLGPQRPCLSARADHVGAAASDRRRCRRPGGQAARRRQTAADRRRRRRARRGGGGRRTVAALASAGARLSARSRRARQPRSVKRHTAARPRAVGRSRPRARRRHPAFLRLHAVGHRCRSRHHPHRCRSRGAGKVRAARGGTHR
jgi:hypothetical protein